MRELLEHCTEGGVRTYLEKTILDANKLLRKLRAGLLS